MVIFSEANGGGLLKSFRTSSIHGGGGCKSDIDKILSEAQTRWLRPAEICEILRNHHMFLIGPEPPNKPSSGSLFLFDRKVLRYFRKDGHIWRKKKDGKTVKEAHEKLKAGSVDVLHCYYAHGEDNENFQRRSYWMLEEDFMHIVLVHYREVQGNKTNIVRTRNTEGLHSSQIGSPLSSSYVTNHNNLHSQTTDSTSLNSGQTSEHEEAESANNYQESSRFHSFPVSQQYEDMRVKGEMDHGLFNSYFYSVPTNQDFILGAGDSEGADSNDAGLGLRSETPKQLTSTSWGEVSEPCTPESYGTPLIPSASSAQSAPVMFGQDFTDEFNSKMDGVNRPRCQDKWKTDPKLQTPVAYDQCIQFSEQKNHHPDLHHSSESFSLHPGQQICYPVCNDHKMQLQYDALGSVVNSDVNDDSAINGIDNHSSIAKYSPLENSETERLKKLDSFNRWMSSELGEVDESYLQTGSVINWDTVESENVVDDSSLSPQVHMDAYLLSTVLSQEQLFSIVDFSPSWAYTDSENKVLITGAFLTNQEDAANCRWSCMFGEMEVPAEVLADGVLRCIAPPHKIGRVPFYVTCSNRLACSEVREFEFRVKYPQDTDMEELHSSSTNDLLLHIRLGKFLSLGSVGQSAASSVVEHSIISSKISLLMKEDEDEWLQMIKLTSEKECSAGIVKDQLLLRILKEKLHAWLLQKVNEDEKGPCVLDKEGQGVLHLAASLGYDWAIAPTVMAGVSINFRDVNGWTALHWAAFCGRERTVVALLQLGAAPGALTDPSPEFPAGRTPADLASSKGHKGIAGFLAETSLTAHLTALNVKDAKDGKIPPMKAIQTVSERIATPATDCNVPDASLKDSLAAVCNATQAAARIHQVFRVQSFQKKKLAEYGDDKSGMSDQRALSLISFKAHRSGQHDEPVHTAAIRIQNKFRGWKGRKDFLLIRQRIVKLQAYVRGHQVRKQYKKIIWSVGIVEKAILRWRRKGTGLRGFRTDTHLEGSTTESGSSKGGKYDFLKEGQKQNEERMHKALARVNSMVRYPEARDQYRRLLTVVTEFQENKVMSDGITNTSEEVGDDIMINLNALLDNETFSMTS